MCQEISNILRYKMSSLDQKWIFAGCNSLNDILLSKKWQNFFDRCIINKSVLLKLKRICVNTQIRKTHCYYRVQRSRIHARTHTIIIGICRKSALATEDLRCWAIFQEGEQEDSPTRCLGWVGPGSAAARRLEQREVAWPVFVFAGHRPLDQRHLQ